MNRIAGKINSKSINRPFDALLTLDGVTVAGGASSVDITSVLTTALLTAGDEGISVPLQLATSTIEGVVVGESLEVRDTSGKDALVIQGEKVYSKVSEALGVYTVKFFTYKGGVETTLSQVDAADLDLNIPVAYRFKLEQLPRGAFLKGVGAFGDAKAASQPEVEELTILTLNTIPTLAKNPLNVETVTVNLDGHVSSGALTNTPFTLVGNTLTWVAADAGFNLDAGDVITVTYYAL